MSKYPDLYAEENLGDVLKLSLVNIFCCFLSSDDCIYVLSSFQTFIVVHMILEKFSLYENKKYCIALLLTFYLNTSLLY